MTTAAALAARLRAMPDDDLVALVAARRLPGAALAAHGPSAVADFFDLADALRTPDVIDRALARLPRATLAALQHPADADPAALAPAVALGLTDGAELDDAVAARLAEHPELRPDDAPRPGGPTPVPQDVDRVRAVAAETAFATLTSLAELVRAVAGDEVHELAKGGIGAPLARHLGERAAADPVRVPDLLALLAETALVDPTSPTWTVTDDGRGWLVAPWPLRWVELVVRWRATLGDPVVEVLALAADDWRGLEALGRWAYPGGAEWLPAELVRSAETAEALGITVDGVVTATGRVLFAARTTDDTAAIDHAGADLPSTVPGVYLQNDLTVIAPGPLEPADDAALRTVADVEAPGLASRYRISEDSVRRALLEGYDGTAVLDTLGRLSAADVPQPVRYLVEQVSARAGSIVVDHAAERGSVVRGPAEQLDLVSVDAELRSLAWARRSPTVLVSPYPPSSVVSALEDQRYPAVLAPAARVADAAGPPVRRRTARTPEEQARELVERLRAATRRGDQEPAQEWMGRQIDLAVRGKVAVRVVVRMPDGTEAPFTIVPTSVSGGRIRGRDTHADVERTLPLSLVIAVEHVA
ncbi:hypothetical protein DEI92_08165 [Curtobacterium sp. MCBD17_034]|uniref:helicase-associated domain-containing protein n=1 Tax=unclassified Curtobacterium TaxID=257496 RepID=UPI000DAA0F56|nr:MULTISPECIES: helicase-associated domain-containing protein [unclassified Curtobacterium]PZF60320.1 hypothetical protein DEI92_08165 [Curtobacterium sp. MCBD17_034]PZM35005.1 hypothetical protein DEI90_06150 [Curtobacterium sp. MCBD17_031]